MIRRSHGGASVHLAGDTPVQAALYGVAGGLAATVLLSILARVLPGMNNQPGNDEGNRKPRPPQNPDDPRQVREWQEQSRSPAAYRHGPDEKAKDEGGPPDVTPAGALVAPVSPGPEGLAEQFAFKFASGLFGRDISRYNRPAGLAVHLAYGSAWGLLFGLLQGSRRRSPLPFGGFFGSVVYLVGPGCLVPAMKIMRPPSEEPPLRTIVLLAGHVLYGMALATAFDRLEFEGLNEEVR